jgi:hypothetical protein
MKIVKDGSSYHVHDGMGNRVSSHKSHEAAMAAVEGRKDSAADGAGAGEPDSRGDRVAPYKGGYAPGGGGMRADVPAGDQSDDED